MLRAIRKSMLSLFQEECLVLSTCLPVEMKMSGVSIFRFTVGCWYRMSSPLDRPHRCENNVTFRIPSQFGLTVYANVQCNLLPRRSSVSHPPILQLISLECHAIALLCFFLSFHLCYSFYEFEMQRLTFLLFKQTQGTKMASNFVWLTVNLTCPSLNVFLCQISFFPPTEQFLCLTSR